MSTHIENIALILPPCVLNSELQAVLIAGLCCVGAWVIFSWFFQLIFSILWPFFMVTALMIIMPGWRKTLATEVFPRQIEILRNLGQKYSPNINTTSIFQNIMR